MTSSTEAPRELRPWSWHAVRVLGLFLAVLVPVHFALVIIAGDVGTTNAGTMNVRFASPWRRTFDWFVITLALAHGLLALHHHLVTPDRSPRARLLLTAGLVAIAVALAVPATLILLTYS
jgi:succinate dehydrogenase / fumarate reductase membrane anchor subunit